MKVVDVGAVLAQGLAAHQAGRFDEAERRYRRALMTHPTHPDALHLLGLVALQSGKFAAATASVRKALTVAPGQPSFWNTLGVAERAGGQLDAAAVSFGRAVELATEYAEAWASLANTHQLRGDQAAEATALERVTALQPANAQAWARRGTLALYADQFEAACALFQESLALAPDDAGVWSNLGVAQLRLGRLADASVSQRRALLIQPDSVFAQSNLGNALLLNRQWDEAVQVLEQVVQRAPDEPSGWLNLGHALQGLSRFAEALTAFERTLALDPSRSSALVGRGGALHGLGDHQAALRCYEEARPSLPNDTILYQHLAIVYGALGDMEQSIAAYHRWLELAPDDDIAASSIIFSMDHHVGASQAAWDERMRWNESIGRRTRVLRRPHTNTPDPDRLLRIGYVSGDFRQHSAGYLSLPVLRSHDHSRVRVYLYSASLKQDDLTERFKSYADVWHDVANLDDDQLVALIRADEIDVLVDLSGHSGGNRLPAFGQEPAPVQVTAWGYAMGTGLDTMHYFLADAVAVPPEARHWYSEEVVNLPSVICYEPPGAPPPVGPPPILERGHVTFGAFNRLDKVTGNVRDTWAQVMHTIPDARLLIKAGGGAEQGRQRLVDDLVARGVARERIAVRGLTDHVAQLAAHNEIDILLDTFPHGGGVTSVEALLMGVPVVTVLGEQVAGRLAASFLTTLGMPDLIARTPHEYVEIAARLAGDRDRLTHERTTLRQRVYASPIGNAQAYTRAVEDVYRKLWGRWASCGAGR